MSKFLELVAALSTREDVIAMNGSRHFTATVTSSKKIKIKINKGSSINVPFKGQKVYVKVKVKHDLN